MNPRKLVIGSVAAVTVGALAMVTFPAIADTRAPNRTAAPVDADGSGASGASAEGVSGEVVAAMRRDLGLTAEQVDARLKKEAWAARTEATLRSDLGTTFAGAWLTGTADRLMIGVTDKGGADRVRAAGAEPKMVARTETVLMETKTRLDRTASTAGQAISGWYVDVASNSVVVLARPGARAAADRAVTTSGVPAAAVRVVNSTEAPRTLFDARGADPFFIGGAGRCSVGFAVEGGFVTAGHCGQPGSTTTGLRAVSLGADQISAGFDGRRNQVAQGTFRASTFPGSGDFGFVETNNQWNALPVVNNFRGAAVPVTGSREAPVGASVCRSGSTTGTRCGVIQAKNATVNYAEGAVTGLTRTNVCAEGGDSGGPWLSGSQGQGVTSGGDGDCRVGGQTFFQPLNEILTANRLELLTSGQR